MMIDTERKLWVVLRDKMGDEWHAQRIEDKYSVGVPDLIYAINGSKGEMELKVVKNITDKIRITNYQRSWLRKHGNHGGGRSFLLIWCYGDEVLALFDHEESRVIHNMADSKDNAVMWCEDYTPANCSEVLKVMLS